MKKEENVKIKKTVNKRNIKKEKEPVVKERKSFGDAKLFIFTIAFFALGIIVGVLIYGKRPYNTTTVVSNSGYMDLYRDIEKNYYNEIVENYDDKIMSAMITLLNDPNSSVYEGIDAISYKENLKNNFIGIGVEVQMNENGELYFVNIFKDSPAAKAGLAINDKLIKVDDTVIEGMSFQDILGLIKCGKEGDIVKLVILREGVEMLFTITKASIVRDTVSVEYLDDNIALVAIEYFSDTTYKELRNKLDEVKGKGISNVAIDLRNNYYGNISVASKIVDLFLDKGKVIYQEKTKYDTKQIVAENDKRYNFNLILVTNGCTAKAAEMMVSALVENLNVQIIGQSTAKNNSIQKRHELKSGNIIEFTVGKWLTPFGNDIENSRILINYEVSDEFINDKIIELFNENIE